MSTLLPATGEIRRVFTEQITGTGTGGTLVDVFEDGDRLFLRSILPGTFEVRPRDVVQRGVALRTRADEILVHPYTFRQVCSNGAIRAHAIETRSIRRAPFGSPSKAITEVIAELREGIGGCSADEAFSTAAEQIRSATDVQADMALTILPVLSHLSPDTLRGFSDLLREILDRFQSDSDRSVFGLMNAVTSIARDTSDPELRWRLEEWGGDMPAQIGYFAESSLGFSIRKPA